MYFMYVINLVTTNKQLLMSQSDLHFYIHLNTHLQYVTASPMTATTTTTTTTMPSNPPYFAALPPVVPRMMTGTGDIDRRAQQFKLFMRCVFAQLRSIAERRMSAESRTSLENHGFVIRETQESCGMSYMCINTGIALSFTMHLMTSNTDIEIGFISLPYHTINVLLVAFKASKPDEIMAFVVDALISSRVGTQFPYIDMCMPPVTPTIITTTTTTTASTNDSIRFLPYNHYANKVQPAFYDVSELFANLHDIFVKCTSFIVAVNSVCKNELAFSEKIPNPAYFFTTPSMPRAIPVDANGRPLAMVPLSIKHELTFNKAKHVCSIVKCVNAYLDRLWREEVPQYTKPYVRLAKLDFELRVLHTNVIETWPPSQQKTAISMEYMLPDSSTIKFIKQKDQFGLTFQTKRAESAFTMLQFIWSTSNNNHFDFSSIQSVTVVHRSAAGLNYAIDKPNVYNQLTFTQLRPEFPPLHVQAGTPFFYTLEDALATIDDLLHENEVFASKLREVCVDEQLSGIARSSKSMKGWVTTSKSTTTYPPEVPFSVLPAELMSHILYYARSPTPAPPVTLTTSSTQYPIYPYPPSTARANSGVFSSSSNQSSYFHQLQQLPI
jgi:hypothetical protein